jgi:hypothetical protein
LRFDQIIEAAHGLHQHGAILDCCLCKNRAGGIGVFIPFAETSKKLGTAPNKTRCIFYGLCARHRKERGVIGKIESAILERGYGGPN